MDSIQKNSGEEKAAAPTKRLALARRILLRSVPIMLLFTVLFWVFDLVMVRQIRSQMVVDIQQRFNLKKQILVDYLEPILSDAHFLNNRDFSGDLSDSNILKRQNQRLKALVDGRRYYDQIRLLTLNGMEVIRLNRDSSGMVSMVSNLQDKSDRYYYKKSLSLGRGEFYISKIDLNIEYGVVELPYKPVIRCCTKVYNEKGKAAGIVVLNYKIETPLQTIRRLVTSDSTFYVMNEQGYFLLHPDTANNFGFMFKDSLSHSFAVEKAGLWKQMSTKHTFNALEDQNFYISQSFDLLDEMQRNFEAMGLNINIRGNGKIVLMHWLSPQLYHGLIWQSRKWLVALWAITLLLVLIWISYQQSQALKQANYIATIEEQNKMLQHQRNRLNAAARTLKAKNRQLKMFNQILVHNFRAPIVSLCNLTNLLVHSDTSAEIDTLKPKFDSLANQLNTLIEDVYQAAQVTNNEHIETQWIDLSEEVKNVLTQFKHELADIQAKVTVDYTWRQLKFSKLYLDSILQNLISNAIKYADESKKLELNFATLEVDDALLLRVSDNGIGIDLNKHGGNMFKLHKRFNREKSGKGMGLFMTKTQIEALEGTIEVDSTPGLGTTFIIKFKKYEK